MLASNSNNDNNMNLYRECHHHVECSIIHDVLLNINININI